ncbi:hypothetical protein [Paraburkholderia metrosideri]|jgi:hypothetical protein|uniref:hypothetical protein n=1 Tax=Paraburkholderia metrosideri TaxID=580937 RepID=UPI001919B9B6|nr:hypothetical protein [Paraburkholderia metrosideri]
MLFSTQVRNPKHPRRVTGKQARSREKKATETGNKAVKELATKPANKAKKATSITQKEKEKPSCADDNSS